MARPLEHLLSIARTLVNRNDEIMGGSDNPFQVAGSLTVSGCSTSISGTIAIDDGLAAARAGNGI